MQYSQKRRKHETPKERETRLGYNRNRWRRILANEIPEEKDIRLQKQREKIKKFYWKSVANETAEQKAIRLAKCRNNQSRLRKKLYDSETPDERKLRLERARIYNRNYYRNSSPKQRKHLQKRERKRRALEIGATGSFTDKEWQALKIRHLHRCVKCGTPESDTTPLCADHIVPLSKGGSDYITNIQPLCDSCNSSKGNRNRFNYRSDQEQPYLF